MRLSIARRYFWVAQTCVWLRVYACVKVQTDLTLTLTPPQGKDRGCLWGKGNATGKWKSKSTLQLQLQCEWTIAQCKCETRKLILRRVWRLSVCPSVCLSVELLCLFICLARSSLPHAVARHPCPALPCRALVGCPSSASQTASTSGPNALLPARCQMQTRRSRQP